MTLNALQVESPDDLGDTPRPFGQYEEEAIVSLIIDHPELFSYIGKYLNYKLFKRTEVQFVVAVILDYYEKYDDYPTRGMLRDLITHELTVDTPGSDDILAIVDRKTNPRDVLPLKAKLLTWAKTQAYGLLYDQETINRYQKGDFEYVEEVFEKARLIQETGTKGLWFFDELDKLFIKDERESFTTGFYQLDRWLDEGGPKRKDLLVWMAPTGVGKCHTLESKIIEKSLSNIYRIELENGKIVEIAGFRDIQTARGTIKVCDLTEEDDIIEIPDCSDAGDLFL